MRIAAVSEDGTTIAPDFGRARQVLVLLVEGRVIVHREIREKIPDARPQADQETRPRDPNDHFAGHRVGPGPRSRYDEMAAAIGDCDAILAGGMGIGAYNALRGYGIQPIITDIEDVDTAVSAYIDGSIRNLTERLR